MFMTQTAATAQRIADDIWSNRDEDITDAQDIKWYLAEECSNHPMPEYISDAVYVLLVAKLAAR